MERSKSKKRRGGDEKIVIEAAEKVVLVQPSVQQHPDKSARVAECQHL